LESGYHRPICGPYPFTEVIDAEFSQSPFNRVNAP
jgi:hypothetical protein